MSCTRRVKSFEVVEVRLDCTTSADLEELEKKLCQAVDQKLDRLNTVTKEMDIYCHGGCLLINDRYKICPELEEIAAAFGLSIKRVDCALRGNNYLVSDSILSLLAEIGVKYELGKNIANQKLTDEIRAVIEKKAFPISVKGDLLGIVENIRQNGSYVTTKTREVVTAYYDDSLSGVTKGEWVSNEAEVRAVLQRFAKSSKEVVDKANAQMLSGTTKLIHTRARQMGYAVEEVKKGKEVQLVLVRLQ